MSEQDAKYQDYLEGHIANVQKAVELFYDLQIPFVVENIENLREIAGDHDKSKYDEPEYTPYLHHFYPANDEEKMETEAFEQACRHHISCNKHHWDYWLDENGELNIPDENEYKLYCVERCADWLAMAYQHGEGPTDWYDANKNDIIMPDYGKELCDEIMYSVPDDFKLVFRGVRGKIDESMSSNKQQLIKLVKGANKEGINDIMYWLQQAGYVPDDKRHSGRQFIIDVINNNYGSDKNNVENAICNGLKKDKEEYLDEHFEVIRGSKGYLIEASMKQLKRKTLTQDPTRAKKSKHVQSKYIGISKYGILNFETTSETHSGVKWYQEIQFPSFNGFMNIVEQGDTIDAEDVKKAMSSDDLKLSCDDPSFLYWAWKYMAWKDIYGLEKETRAPKRNNTRLQGALCKHLYSVIELISEKRIIDLIARDLNQFCLMKLGKDNKGYQDSEGMLKKDFKADQYDYNVEAVMKDLLSVENYNKYMDGTPLEDLGLSDSEIADIDKAISGMRSSSQFALKSELEKQLEPVKRGRKITRDDIKLQVGSYDNEEEEDEK